LKDQTILFPVIEGGIERCIIVIVIKSLNAFGNSLVNVMGYQHLGFLAPV
jgi:hypothetical protein